MTTEEYQKECYRTEPQGLELFGITARIQHGLEKYTRIFHAVLGIMSEAGELCDQFKKHIFYGRPLDIINVREEIGDMLWYITLMCNALGLDLENIMEDNINKLRERYPEKFKEADATERKDKKNEG